MSDEIPSHLKPVRYVAKLVGRTVGVAQRAGTETADAILAAGGRARKFLHGLLKVWSLEERRRI